MCCVEKLFKQVGASLMKSWENSEAPQDACLQYSCTLVEFKNENCCMEVADLQELAMMDRGDWKTSEAAFTVDSPLSNCTSTEASGKHEP